MRFHGSVQFVGMGVVAILVCQSALAGTVKPRVYITDSQSWQVSGGGGGTSGGFGEAGGGGARPQTAEIIKTFGERCPDVTVNNQKEKADYIVLLDHEGGKDIIGHDNKVAVFNKEGDSIVSHSTRTLGNAVKDACTAIQKDWPQAMRRANAAAEATQSALASDPPPAAASAGRISVSSNPVSADIEVDGSFVGNTPSTVEVSSGEHTIAIKKAGYQTWQRTLKIMPGAINVSAELERAQ